MNHEAAARHAQGLRSAALTLHAHSQRLLAAIPSGRYTDESSFQAVFDQLGHSVGSVVLLSFAIEVMIKAIAAKGGVDPKRTHHLGQLFGALACETQNSVEGRFLTVWRLENEADPPTKLRAVLDEAATAFEDWRYQFEGKQSSLGANIIRLKWAFVAIQEEYAAP
jgi:hypothetical protein